MARETRGPPHPQRKAGLGGTSHLRLFLIFSCKLLLFGLCAGWLQKGHVSVAGALWVVVVEEPPDPDDPQLNLQLGVQWRLEGEGARRLAAGEDARRQGKGAAARGPRGRTGHALTTCWAGTTAPSPPPSLARPPACPPPPPCFYAQGSGTARLLSVPWWLVH